MSTDLPSTWTPRRTLFSLAGGFGAAVAVWLLAWGADLHDGRTWHKRSRYETGPLFYAIDNRENPSSFKITVMTRYVMPVTLLGSISLICLLGGLSQPKGKAE